MLMKRQLEDAAECLARFHERTCGQCSCNKFRYGYVGSYGCTENAAQTALAYREMLDKLVEELRDAFDSGVFFGRRVNYLKTQLEEAEKLLKESEGEE